MISSALQRRVWYYCNPITGHPEHNAIFPHQFVALCGPPATGKGRPIKIVDSVLSHNDMKKSILDLRIKDKDVSIGQTGAVHLTPQSITFEGLFDFLNGGKGSDPRYAGEDAATNKVDAIRFNQLLPTGTTHDIVYTHTSATMLLEELCVLINKTAEDVVPLLCQTYDAGKLWRYTKTAGKNYIERVCLNILSAVTPDDMSDLMKSGVVRKGLSSRFVFVYAQRPRFRKFDNSAITIEQQGMFNDLVKHVKLLATKTVGVISLTAEAHEYMRVCYESADWERKRNPDRLMEHYYGRRKLHWYKLAAAVHFAETTTDMTIGLASVVAADELLTRTENVMHLAMRGGSGTNKQKDIADDIASLIADGATWTYKKLWLKVASNCNRQEFDETLMFMSVTDQITRNGDLVTIKRGDSVIDTGVIIDLDKRKAS